MIGSMIEMLSYAPEIATAAGFVGGAVVNHVAGNHGDMNRRGVLSTQGVSDEELASRRLDTEPHLYDDIEEQHKSFAGGVVANTLRHPAVPVAVALAAGLSVHAWVHDQGPKVNASVLGIVGDKSSKTLDGSNHKVDSIFHEFEQTGKIRVRARVAHNYSSDAISVQSIERADVYGPSSMESATAVSMGEVYSSASPANSASGTGERRNGGILAVTDNNGIGSVESVVRLSRENGNQPIFVANVGKENGQATRDLKTIAKKTGGHYWTVDGKNAGAVARNVEEMIKPQEVKDPTKPDPNYFEKFLSVMSIMLAGGMIKARAGIRFTGKQRETK
jgi:hypothetical protein